MTGNGQRTTDRSIMFPPRPIRVALLIVYWAVMFSATHWPNVNELRPEGGWPIPYFSRVMHVSIYVGWTVLWWWVLSAPRGRGSLTPDAAGGQDRPSTRGARGETAVSGRAVVWLLLGGTAWAAFDESTQGLIPGRTVAFSDFLFNLAGLYGTTAVLWTWQSLRRPAPPAELPAP